MPTGTLGVSLCSLGKNGDKSYARTGFTDERGEICLPPKSLKKFTAWADKMKIPEVARATFLKSAGN